MKWFKVSLVLGMALLISVAAFGASGTMGFSRFLNVAGGTNWNGGSFVIDEYGGVFTVHNVLAINFEVDGQWRILARAWVSGGTDPKAVLNAFEIGLDNAQGHQYAGYNFAACDFTWQGQTMPLLADTCSVDESEANPVLFFAWDTNDLTGHTIGGKTYSFTVNFSLVSP